MGKLHPKSRRKKSLNSFTPKDLAAIAYEWSQAELLEMKAIIDSLIEAKQVAEESPKKGYFEDKIVNGYGPYRYLRYWSKGKRKSVYVGKVEELI